MAKNQRQLEGWTYILDSGESSVNVETTRTRRSRKTEEVKITLKRDDDGLELIQGDCILIDQKDGSPEVGLIREINFGIDDFIEIKIMWFIKISDVEIESLPINDSESVAEDKLPTGYTENDIFVTAIQDKVFVTDIIDKATVLSIEEFKSITIDESNKDTTFVCQRGCGSSSEGFSDILDWREFHELVVSDSNGFLQKVKSLTVAPTVRAAKAPVKKKPTKPVVPKKKTVREEIEPEPDFDSEEVDGSIDSDKEVGEFSSSESDESLHDSESDFEEGKKGKRKRKVVKVTPKKPHKRSKKVAAEPIGTLPSLPSRLDFGDSSDNEEANKTPLFKEARKRLHANAKLKSLPCREEESNQIYLSLEDAIETQIGTCIYVSGTPGTGKTATIREVVKQLAENYIEKAQNPDEEKFDYVEINGLKLISPQSSYEVLWEKISGERVSASNAAVLLETYFKKTEKNRKPLVVLMDELDQIVTKTQTVMYNFFNWPTYPSSKLIVIAVANTMDLPERMLTNKISSRLGLKRLQFPGYNYKQLTEIIKHRLEDLERLNSGKLIIKKDAIEFAARKVASVSGDARRALIICRRAIEIAEWEYFKAHQDDKEEENQVYTVQIMHIMKAVNETTNSPVSQFLQSLPFVSKLFISCLLSRKKKSGFAENTMDSIIDEMNAVVTMQTSSHLNKNLLKEKIDLYKMLYGVERENMRIEGFKFVVQELIESGILLQQNEQGERLAVVKLNISDDEIINVFKKDDNLQGIAGF